MNDYVRVSVSIHDNIPIERVWSVVFKKGSEPQTESDVIGYVVDPSKADNVYEMFDPNTGLPLQQPVRYASVVGFVHTDIIDGESVNATTNYETYVVSKNIGGHYEVKNTTDNLETYVFFYNNMSYGDINNVNVFKTDLRGNIVDLLDSSTYDDVRILNVWGHTVDGNVIAEVRVRNPTATDDNALRTIPIRHGVVHYYHLKASLSLTHNSLFPASDLVDFFETIQLPPTDSPINLPRSVTVLNETASVFSRNNKNEPVNYHMEWVLLFMFASANDRDAYKQRLFQLENADSAVYTASSVDVSGLFQNIVFYM